MDEKKDIKFDVSVVMTTYGHEDFILEAILGVLQQDFRGNIELIISNDKSPDNTNELVIDYLNSIDLPSNIDVKYYLQEKNLGAVENFLWVIKQAKGDYLALCEGDDFWSNPLKLSIQVGFLKNNWDYSILFTNVHVLIENGEYNQTNELTSLIKDREYYGQEIIEKWIAHTSTFLIRNSIEMSNFDTFFRKHNFMYGDTPLFLYALTFGKGYGLKEYTSTYRRHEGGLTNQVQDNLFYLKFIKHLKNIKAAYPDKEYHGVLNKSIKGFYLRLFFNTKATNYQKYLYLGKALQYDKYLFLNIIKDKVKGANISL